MLRGLVEGFLLGYRRHVWVIEGLFGKGDDDSDWRTLGSITGVDNAASAVAAAKFSWPDLRRGIEIRAIEWGRATAEQREVADHEDNLRDREESIRRHEHSFLSGLVTLGDVKRGSPQKTAKPVRDEKVILHSGEVARITAAIYHSSRGHVIEIENGAFAEVEPNPDKRNPVPWREVSDENRT